jgi:hypothetical protein
MEEPEEKQQKQLKIEWVCEECTIYNTNMDLICSVCQCPPHESAYVAVEEVVKQFEEPE